MAEQKRIMVIEDEELLLEAIVKKLEKMGNEVVSCTSAKDALEHLSEDSEKPDVIWLDYYLEDMNGLEFMNKIKENEEWSKIPVVVVSNSASPQKVNTMLALGVKKYFLKAQYRLEDIINAITEI